VLLQPAIFALLVPLCQQFSRYSSFDNNQVNEISASFIFIHYYFVFYIHIIKDEESDREMYYLKYSKVHAIPKEIMSPTNLAMLSMSVDMKLDERECLLSRA